MKQTHPLQYSGGFVGVEKKRKEGRKQGKKAGEEVRP